MGVEAENGRIQRQKSLEFYTAANGVNPVPNINGNGPKLICLSYKIVLKYVSYTSVMAEF